MRKKNNTNPTNKRNKRNKNTFTYKNGIIYKIFHKTLDNIVYIGSTVCRLSTRWKRHKISYSKWNNGYSKGKCAICPYFKKYGIKNFDCVILRKYKIVDSKHLNTYEQLWLNKIKNINKNMVFNPAKFYKKYYKKTLKNLLKNEKEELKEKNKTDKLLKKISKMSIKNK